MSETKIIINKSNTIAGPVGQKPAATATTAAAATSESSFVTPALRPDLSGRCVLITGGGAGIGRCLTLSYAQTGADVYFVDLNPAAGEETLSILRAQQLTARFFQLDLADDTARQQLVSELLTVTNGKLDILINNAAIAHAHADFDRALAVNLAAPYHLTQLLTPALIAAQGNVISIASTRAFMSEPDTEGYSASKGGLVALTHAMAISLGQQGVRVNSIAPGWIDTTQWQLGQPAAIDWTEAEHRQHPAGRIGRPADIAAACFYLSGSDAGFVTGENIVVDGGMTRKMIYL